MSINFDDLDLDDMDFGDEFADGELLLVVVVKGAEAAGTL